MGKKSAPQKHTPPKLAVWLLQNLSDPEEADSLLGDSTEEYSDYCREKGPFRSRCWYWIQVLISLPSFCKSYLYWSVTMFKNYLKIALRTILKHKGYSFINIAGLAVGIACCVLILLWVQDELSYDRFHENSNDIYRTTLNIADSWGAGAPWALGPTLKKDFPEVQTFTRYGEITRLVRYEDRAYNESIAFADPEFFDIFSFPFVGGRPDPVFPTITSIVITERTAKKYFGNEEPIGKMLNFNNQADLTVTGIIKEVPTNSHMEFDIVIPVLLFGERINTEWSIESGTYVLLDENTDLNAFREKISGIAMKYDRRTDQTILVGLQPLSRIHLYSLNGGGNIIYIYIFSFIAVIILLIACINFMNLSTARGGTRAKEVGMRKLVGARRSNVIKQFYGESLLLAVFSLFVAIGLVFLFLPSFNSLAQKTLSFDLGNNLLILTGLLGITLFTGIISGSYPALLISSFHPAKVIKGSLSAGSSKSALRKILVVSQFTIAIVLIIGTLVVYKQLHYIRNRDLGFSRDQVLSLYMSQTIQPSYPALKEELLKHPSVLNVTAASNRPNQVGNINPVYWEGRGPDQYETWNFISTDFDYVKTFDMEIVMGRDFSKEFETDKQNYIINEEGLKRTGLQDPIGKLFSIWDNEGQIVGVVKNFHSVSLHNEMRPVVITLLPNWRPSILFVKLRPENIQATLKDLEKTWSQFAPNFPFEFQFLDEAFEAQYRTDQRTGSLFRTFALLAIFISCMGIFGLASFMAERRTKEIGVRKVLGASIPNIMGLISKEFMILLTVANVIAWPAAYFLARSLLSRYAYRTNIGLWVFLVAGVMAYMIALITVSYQAFKAARTDPAHSLRYE